jgi:hypothetical protein
VWGVLRNLAYKGEACFGKTTMAPRQRITRPIRMRGGVATRNSASHERAREDWITIAVPPIVSEETFALAQERLQANKIHAPRRTVTPSVVQGPSVATPSIGLRRDRAHVRSIIIDALAPTPTGILLVPSATTALFVRISLTMWFGQRLCSCSKILALSRMSLSGDSWRLARLIRQNVATRRSSVIWSVFAKASNVCSPLIRKVFSRSKNCASECRSCDDANRRAMPNCRRLPIGQSPAQPTCASLRR